MAEVLKDMCRKKKIYVSNRPSLFVVRRLCFSITTTKPSIRAVRTVALTARCSEWLRPDGSSRRIGRAFLGNAGEPENLGYWPDL